MQKIQPNFMVNGGSQAFVVLDNDSARFQLLSVMQDGALTWADPDDQPVFRALASLCALFTEVAIDNDREREIRVDQGTGRREEQVSLSPIAEVWARLLPEGMSHPKEWTVSVSATMLAYHDTERERLWAIFEDEQGGDLFAGERRLLFLLMKGNCPIEIRAGDKVLRYDSAKGRFFFQGSNVWTAEEMVIMAMWLLSDEATEEPCPEQYGPFLVQALRPVRGAIEEGVISSAILTAESAAAPSSSPPPATEARATASVPTAEGDVAQEASEPERLATAESSSSTDTVHEPDPLIAKVTAGGSVLERVIQAGQAAEVEDGDELDVTRAEGARDAFLRKHQLRS